MRRTAVALLLPALLLPVAHARAAAKPKPQVTDAGGDSLATKSQDIRSVQFRVLGTGGARALVVTMTTWADVMPQVSLVNFEVDAKATCGDVSFSMSPGTPYEAVTGLNGWYSTSCGGDVQELTAAQVSGPTITWTMPLGKAFKKGTVFTDFEARIDPAQPALPFPSSATATTLGLVDKATSKGPWRLP
jgi:hypothetical protein